MKKIKNWIFINKGKEKWYFRLYIVLCYMFLITSVMLSVGISYDENDYSRSKPIDAVNDITNTYSEYFLKHDSPRTDEDIDKFRERIRDAYIVRGFYYTYDSVVDNFVNESVPENILKMEEESGKNLKNMADMIEQKRLEVNKKNKTDFIKDFITWSLWLTLSSVVTFIILRSVLYRVFLFILFGDREIK